MDTILTVLWTTIGVVGGLVGAYLLAYAAFVVGTAIRDGAFGGRLQAQRHRIETYHALPPDEQARWADPLAYVAWRARRARRAFWAALALGLLVIAELREEPVLAVWAALAVVLSALALLRSLPRPRRPRTVLRARPGMGARGRRAPIPS